MPGRCVIVGAGLAGLTAGRRLQQLGWSVTLLDKGRTCGGRMATRSFGGGVFDHGAQFFTVRDERFEAEVQRWILAGVAREWFTQEGHPRYCGVRGMNDIVQYLAHGLEVHVSEHVEQVSAGAVQTRAGCFQGDAVILTAPMEQSLAMLQDPLPDAIRSKLHIIAFEPCFAVMACLNSPSEIPEPGYVRPESGPISWMADNQRKGISPVPAVTIHAQPDFTRTHWETDRQEVARLLVKASQMEDVGEVQVQRWKYSMLSATLPERCVSVAGPQRLVFAGDAFGGPRVEGAFLSGLAAADALMDHVTDGGQQAAR